MIKMAAFALPAGKAKGQGEKDNMTLQKRMFWMC